MSETICLTERSEAHFDSRVFTLPSLDRAVAYVRWRAVHDCRRNSVSMLAQAHFHHTQLDGLDARSMLRLLQEALEGDDA